MMMSMKRSAALGALALAGAVLGAVGGLRADDAELAWETDLAAARQKARQEGKPLLIVFR